MKRMVIPNTASLTSRSWFLLSVLLLQVKRMVIPDALKVLRLQHGHRYCQLGALAASVGWKHKEAVEALEAKRKVKVSAGTAGYRSRVTRETAKLGTRPGAVAGRRVGFFAAHGERPRMWSRAGVARGSGGQRSRLTRLVALLPFHPAVCCLLRGQEEAARAAGQGRVPGGVSLLWCLAATESTRRPARRRARQQRHAARRPRAHPRCNPTPRARSLAGRQRERTGRELGSSR